MQSFKKASEISSLCETEVPGKYFPAVDLNATDYLLIRKRLQRIE